MSQDIRQDTPLLAVRGLDVDIAGESGMTHAVKRLQLAISQRETFALVGESGCGKSMTALALLRLLPDAGRIVGGQIDLDGEDLNRLPESAMRGVRGGRIGIIFQEPSTSLNPVMRVGDQIIETLVAHTPLRGAAARARAIDWLRRVGIPEPERRVDDYPFQFSGGQKQRVMIAIALAAEPLLLIADEPTTALDVTVQAQVLALLADIQREIGMAVLLITHDLAVVRNVAHHVALMRGGEIVESASAEEFFRAPKHPYARQLFDAIPTFEKRGVPLSEAGRAALGADAAVARKRAREPGVVLDVQDLKVHYPVRKGPLRRVASWVKAVDGVTFSLRAGETLALLGESGCGKTTTGKALLRLIDGARISGRAMLQGQDLLTADRARLQRLRQDIQIVFQDPYASLDPRMRVGDILDEGLESLRRGMGAQARRDRAVRLVERVGLPANTLARYPHEFSGGQRQRIAIARALAVEPKVLICDEPTSALDVSVQAQILDLLRELQDELGIAYLFITHNFGVVEYLADRIAVMEGGRIVELGEADAVLHAPRQDMTRRLLEAVPRLQFGQA
ncbi:MAG: ABC transporter ATP-binding protein [Achromobacter sp.]|jgi:peptide/nickel transport system ATP-binding protein|uniref:Putative ABC transporter ATP-binding protein YejF n=2 Tax=Achromobacter insuavis TaxID=1287735 RepID=A0A6J5HJF8_9BURK|nr:MULTISPECIES: dipeptide ABC transporter ATP-binding protein [Achromobacter]MBN9637275.1 ABC transporter ATP-binding protein [Achromobacter sp.]CAB3656992.1 putative ABC transporter ATP-binding protein YejF [Achromobacter insuavis]CAB3846968.1 putative ABC transporter ATP-binding protein YejF [Achromobacter insuavis]CUI33472.1 Glutathione import ATP-binding protein GsiA [Achromobacter sp. 2789STDY5608621]CUI85600.1 Glutathione import ATP-binding protein GsiA [Achromobacter sp. 2789STDY560862